MKKSIKLLFFLILFVVSFNFVFAEELTTTNEDVEFIFEGENTIVYYGKSYKYKIVDSYDQVNIELKYEGCTYFTNINPKDSIQTYGRIEKCDNDQSETARKLLNKIQEHENISYDSKKKEIEKKEYKTAQKETSGTMILLLLVFAITGLISVIKPKAMWYLSNGWRYKNAKPSDAALLVNRIAGILLLILAVVVLLNML